jgi:serine/threonine-protein kinase
MSDRDPFDLCGTTIDGKYRVLSVVGQGGFGVVYKGVHAGFEAPVAVKCLKLPPHFDLAAQEALVRQLREEGRMLMRLSQRTPGILQALDVGSFTTPGGARVPYLVLEWLEGRTLADEIRARHTRSLGEAVAFLDPAARALSVAHEEKIAHRDIKPENMFCIVSGGRPTIKILDFGIAKLLGDAASPTSGTAIGGPSMFTPTYAAPEQFDKKRGATGPWTDVFAFALVLVEMVTGRPALEGDGIFALYHASSNPAERPTLRARGALAPEVVDRVIEKALHPEPARRFPDMGSFWQALHEAMASAGEVVVLAPDLAGSGPRANFESARTVQVAAPHTTEASTQVNAATTKRAVAPAPSDTVPVPAAPARGRGGWVALGIVVLAGAGGLGVAATRGWISPGARAVPSASAAPSVSAEPPPPSQNAAAAALYREAMQGWHDGSLDRAIRDMERAIVADRELGAGHLRLALWHLMAGSSGGKLVEGREHFQKALLHRNALSELDRGLLNAAEPYVRQPWDLDEWGKRLEELTHRFPDDAEILVYLGSSYYVRLQPDAAIAAYDRALAKDPGLLAARVAEADSLWMKGEPEAQLEVYDACLKVSSAATQCLVKRLTLQAQLGHCAAMKADAQSLLSIDPRAASTQRQLALALSATGSSVDSVREALKRSWDLEDERDRRWTELEDQAALASLSGDFASAERRLEEWQVAVADRPDQTAHATPAQHLAELFTEVGQPRKASDAAGAFLRKMNAWTDPPNGSLTVLFLSYQLRAGAIPRPEYERQRAQAIEAFRAKWQSAGRKLDDDFAWLSWSMAYGVAVATEEEARAAVAAMPPQRSKAVDAGRWVSVDMSAGRAYALAGAFAAAVPPLRRIADGCLVLADPMSRTQAAFYLGLALEGTGDPDGARAAYRKVVERWGKPIPKSITAEKARRRLLVLGDKKN